MLTEVGNHDTLLRDFPTGVYAKLVKQQQDAEENHESPVDILQESEDENVIE